MSPVQIVLQTNYDEELAALYREATAAKKEKDWDRAIACLRQANERVGLNYDIPGSLRLPSFLQQAGRFDEAMLEFNRLLADVENYVGRTLDHATPNIRRSAVASHCFRIYDKMRLACQREKRTEDAERYAALYQQHCDIHSKWQVLVREERKKRHQDHEEWMDDLRAGIRRDPPWE